MTKTFTVEAGNGQPVQREVNYTANVDDFRGMAGFALILLAANPHLTAGELWQVLTAEHCEANQCQRSEGWIYTRGNLFKLPGAHRSLGKCDRDGRYPEALTLMRAHPEMSLRDLVRLLAEHGIKRGKDWARIHRCDPVPV